MTAVANVRATLLRAFDVAVAAAHPDAFVPESRTLRDLREPEPGGRTVVLGAGKAAASMARTLVRAWPLRQPPSGLVVVRDGYGLDAGPIEVIEAGHPRPDARSVQAAERIAALARALGPRDQAVVLLSGGASSLLAHPVDGVSLDEAAGLFDALMHAGADIRSLNAVRQHVTRLAGGGLAKLIAPARCLALVLSDVVGDDPAYIASGPLTPAVSTAEEILQTIKRFGVHPPPGMEAALRSLSAYPPASELSAPCEELETVPSAIWIDPTRVFLEGLGYKVVLVDPAADGDARDLGWRHAEFVRGRFRKAHQLALLSAGEATAPVRGDGRGGPNSEYALSLSLALDGHRGINAIACDTDGSDGSTFAAGALIDPSTLARAAAHGLKPQDYLNRSDSGSFFATLRDQVVTGPTYTNVNDFRLIIVT